MKVNFNNVRKRALHRYEDLADMLNKSIIKTDDEWARPNDASHSINLKGYVVIDAEDLDDVMNDLRMLISTAAMTYEEGNDDFKDVFSESFPEGTSKEMICFNREEDF